MKPPTTAELLRLWEDGAAQSLLEKTLRLLGAACALPDYRSAGSIPLGERDLRLLQLREWMFGTRMQNTADCPRCGQIVEWETDTRQLRLQSLPPDVAQRKFLLEQDGYQLSFRLPDSMDIARIRAGCPCITDHRHLIADCIIELNGDPARLQPEALPASIWAALEKEMETLDPQADINMEMSCEACRYTWRSWFDIVSYLWAEINTWAVRCLREVYMLAKAFGWPECDILEMPPRRRQLYLQMLNA